MSGNGFIADTAAMKHTEKARTELLDQLQSIGGSAAASPADALQDLVPADTELGEDALAEVCDDLLERLVYSLLDRLDRETGITASLRETRGAYLDADSTVADFLCQFREDTDPNVNPLDRLADGGH